MSSSIHAVVRDGDHTPPVRALDVAAPVPGIDEVLVDVHASSINRGELALLGSRPDGWRPGQDVAGVVAAAAADGSGPAVGTRILATVDAGAWATQVAVPVARLAPLPEAVSFKQGATLGIAGLTALRVVRRAGPLLGRRLLVTGAGGGVGHLVTQLARLSGATVIADDHDEGPFDVVLEGVGGRSLERSVGALAPGGTIVLYGASDPTPAQLTLLSFLGRENARIETFFSYAAPESAADDLAILAGLVAEGRLRPEVAGAYELGQVAEALTALAGRGVTGKLVLLPQR